MTLMVSVSLWLKTTIALRFKKNVKMVAHGNKIAPQNGEILIRLDINTVVVASFVQTINAHTGKNLAWQIKSISKKIDYVVYVEPLEKR